MAQTEKENMNNSCSEQKNEKIQCELLAGDDLNMMIVVVDLGRHQKHSGRTEKTKEISFGDTTIRW